MEERFNRRGRVSCSVTESLVICSCLGIGGFFRGLVSLFRPVVRTVGSSIAKAATSDTAKSIAKTLGEQALDSTLNMTKDYLTGNDMTHSLDREVGKFKETGANIIDDVRAKRRKPNNGTSRKSPKVKPSLKLMRKYDKPRRY